MQYYIFLAGIKNEYRSGKLVESESKTGENWNQYSVYQLIKLL